jgi:hypothetical protein
MSGSKSKNKGSGFERELAKYLSETYESSFVRASHSGAYVGGTNNHRKSFLSNNQIRSFKGDIIPPDDWVKFNAEAKFYADFGFHQLFTNSAMLSLWIQQLMIAADDDDVSILFMKFNRKGSFIAVQSGLQWDRSCNHMTYHDEKHGEWIIYSFEKFFEYNTDLLRDFSKIA